MDTDSWESTNAGSWARGLGRWYKDTHIMNWEGQLFKKVLQVTLNAYLTRCKLSANACIFSHKHSTKLREDINCFNQLAPGQGKHTRRSIISSRVTHAERRVCLNSYLHPHWVWVTHCWYKMVTLTCKRLILTHAISQKKPMVAKKKNWQNSQW